MAKVKIESLNYAPGNFSAFITNQLIVFYGESVGTEALSTIWKSASVAMSDPLELLRGTILFNFQSYGIILENEDRYLAYLKGPIELQIITSDKREQKFNGIGYSTWNEVPLKNVSEIWLQKVGDKQQSNYFPVSSGIILASGFHLKFENSSASQNDVTNLTQNELTSLPNDDQTQTASNLTNKIEQNGPSLPKITSPSISPVPTVVAPVLSATQGLSPTPSITNKDTSAPSPTENSSATSDQSEDYDYLFGATIHNPVEFAAVREQDNSEHENQSEEETAKALEQQNESSPVDINELNHENTVISPTNNPIFDNKNGQPSLIDFVPIGNNQPIERSEQLASFQPSISTNESQINYSSSIEKQTFDSEKTLAEPDSSIISEDTTDTTKEPVIKAIPKESPTVLPTQGPLVQTILCSNNHANPPVAASCRICGLSLENLPVNTLPRPTLGILRFSTGHEVELNSNILIGRKPKVEKVDSNKIPQLVVLDSADHNISRNHVEILIQGWNVVVKDLDSVNGTLVELPSQPPVRIRPNEATQIVPGTKIIIADEVNCIYYAK